MSIGRWVLGFAMTCSILASVGGHEVAPADAMPALRPGDRVLFQGDSITDGNRGRNADPNHILGHGYAFLIAADAAARFPERRLTFVNRGVSGNKVSDLARRWQSDAVDLQPTVLSILIGVNDLNANVPAEQFEQQYDALLTTTAAALPNARLVLCEPFGLPTGKKKEGWTAYGAALAERQAIVSRLAQKHRAPVVRFQQALEDAARRAPAEHWIWDGIHPTYAGHRVLADEWLRTVNARWGAATTSPATSAPSE